MESGDDELLDLMSKGETGKSTIEGLNMAHAAGIDTSVMIINGLGGQRYSHQHALHSAEVIDQISPRFLSTLTLSLPLGPLHFKRRFKGEYKPMTILELAQELKLFMQNLHVDDCIFRSDHISNSLILKGRLGRDQNKLIQELEEAIKYLPPEKYPEEPSIL
jgi:radical SAM superfamily enzyme YgiQ (UPF0313 family)